MGSVATRRRDPCRVRPVRQVLGRHGVSGFSRLHAGWMVPSRAAHDVLGGMLQVLATFGAVPRLWVWDQEGCIGQWRQGRQRLTDEFQAFRGTLGMGVKLCAPADPEAKGLVERTHDYYETSFLPGRRFDDVADFNPQFTSWLRRANKRIHATTRQRPAEAIFEDRGSMLASRRCCPTRRGGSAPACRGITSCGSTPTTTRSTLASSVAASTSASPSTKSSSPATAPRWPGTAVSSRNTRRCSPPSTCGCCARCAPKPRRRRADAGRHVVEERDLAVYDRIGEVG